MNYKNLITVVAIAWVALHLLEGPLKTNGWQELATLAGISRRHHGSLFGPVPLAVLLAWHMLPGGGGKGGGRGDH